MLTRRTLLKLPVLGALAIYLPVAWPAPEIRRRALIVGIDKYVPTGSSGDTETPLSSGHAGASASATKRNLRFHNLDGAVNDATLMDQLLKDRFSFEQEDIVFLRNDQATRDQILHEFRAHLIDAASPGDVSLFYYAGHGSQVRNLASDEADQLDETLVPADSASGALDIRDKEMARLYRAALKKGLLLTVVLDSCHSGGMSRGGWNASGKTRDLPPDPRPVNDPPDVDPVTGKKLPDATTMGMLFLGAAREDQPAGETTVVERDDSGGDTEISHGAFTAALAKALDSAVASQSVEQICNRVQATLASQGSLQVPICAGGDRESRGLLGQAAGSTNSISLSVELVGSDGVIRLRGGSALGLAPGCLLVRSNTSAVHIQLTHVDLGTSEARLIPGTSSGKVQVGDLFNLETWVTPPNARMGVFFPKNGPTPAAVLAVANSIAGLSGHDGIQVSSDIEPGNHPTHVIYWRDDAYQIERFPFDGKAVHLGQSPSVDEIAKALDGARNVRLWPMIPPDRQTAAGIRVGTGTENAAIDVVGDSADCIYLLVGRLHEGKVEYSWMFKDMLIADPNKLRLPLQTDLTASTEQLTSLATRLGRIYGWLNLNGPTGGDHAFPYRLVFEKQGGQESAGTGPFKIGERYKFVFVADPENLRQAADSGGVSKRYVYVFLIDSAGNATCLFPNPANGNDGNRLPRTDPPAPRIDATPADYDLEISEPAGTDNYFLVASEQPLDPDVFQWTGVRGPSQQRGASNPLEFLFTSVGEGTRGATKAPGVPATWSIQSMAIRSQA
jgi:hypothetical protein